MKVHLRASHAWKLVHAEAQADGAGSRVFLARRSLSRADKSSTNVGVTRDHERSCDADFE